MLGFVQQVCTHGRVGGVGQMWMRRCGLLRGPNRQNLYEQGTTAYVFSPKVKIYGFYGLGFRVRV